MISFITILQRMTTKNFIFFREKSKNGKKGTNKSKKEAIIILYLAYYAKNSS
jgi:hypothetical protein